MKNLNHSIRNLTKRKFFILFLSVFLIFLLISQIYVFSEPPVYQSETIISVKNLQNVEKNTLNSEQLNNLEKILVAEPILERTHNLLKNNTEKLLSINDLRLTFTIKKNIETNKIILIAEGTEPQLLQTELNTWIEAYNQALLNNIKKNPDIIKVSTNKEQKPLPERLKQLQSEIYSYEEQYNIFSAKNKFNKDILDTVELKQSLNNAQEAENNAKAKIASIKTAIAEGSSVLPKVSDNELALLLEQSQKLKQNLDDIHKKYTDEYIRINPTLRKVREELITVESKIEEKTHATTSEKPQNSEKPEKPIVLLEAEHDYLSATETIKNIKKQIQQHQLIKFDFNKIFAEHDRLQQEISIIETELNKNQPQTLAPSIEQGLNYPEINIISIATLPDNPIRPDYKKNAILSFLASLLISLIATLAAKLVKF